LFALIFTECCFISTPKLVKTHTNVKYVARFSDFKINTTMVLCTCFLNGEVSHQFHDIFKQFTLTLPFNNPNNIPININYKDKKKLPYLLYLGLIHRLPIHCHLSIPGNL
jgi:hypothetical protein